MQMNGLFGKLQHIGATYVSVVCHFTFFCIRVIIKKIVFVLQLCYLPYNAYRRERKVLRGLFNK